MTRSPNVSNTVTVISPDGALLNPTECPSCGALIPSTGRAAHDRAHAREVEPLHLLQGLARAHVDAVTALGTITAELDQRTNGSSQAST